MIIFFQGEIGKHEDMKRPDFLSLPPAEAIAFFRNKVDLPTEQWNQLTAEQHDHVFTVAGIARADFLQAIRWMLDRAIADGASYEAFDSQFERLVAQRGWSPARQSDTTSDWRRKVIFDMNVRRAYAAGRQEQMDLPAFRASRPYRQWRHRDSIVPRPNHLALHGKIFRADDPELRKIAFPCGFGCRCALFSLSARYVEEGGLTVERFPDASTIADPGFLRSGAEGDRAQVLQQALKRLDPDIRVRVEQDLSQRGLL